LSRFDAIVRRLVPSVPVLSRNRLLMAPLDLLDRLLSLPFGGAGKLPPNRLRIRVGAGNRILFNQLQHRLVPVNFWLGVFASGLVRLDSRILDLGCGCGRYAATLRDFAWAGKKFTGRYTGIDIDREPAPSTTPGAAASRSPPSTSPTPARTSSSPCRC
jgi:SAM-dependent methyltransferase